MDNFAGKCQDSSTDGNRKPRAPKGQCSGPTKVKAATWGVTREEFIGSGWEVRCSRKTAKQAEARVKPCLSTTLHLATKSHGHTESRT